MKNLAKIFMAVAVAMFAFACVTDTTEDLGIQINKGGGITELSLSLEESRTHLGEKADGIYPLYWSDGDAIAVNGAISTPLAAQAAGQPSATFQISGDVAYPYCVVYPASAVATVEGEETEAPVTAYPVNFLAEQPYTVGTFAPQAAPMYGYAETAETIEMHHLTGVLRLAIAGNGEKVTSIVVKAQNGKIAGAYTVDCTNGTLTPSAEATNTVTVTFAEPLVLGAEATPVYVAVPAGNYGTFAITINTEAHQKMTVKFNSDVKPINAATVREFSAFTYEANANDAEDTFIIDSKEALIEFARIASTFYPRTAAKVTASIDMTGYDWTPIANFGAFEFDGGSEKGYSIKGLTAPLFGTTSATIKNVKLTNVNIVETEDVKVGAIARILSGSMENCSAAGTLEMNNTTFAGSVKNEYNDICVGGLLGDASGATVTNSTNDVDITITSFCASTLKCKATAGGVIGGVRAASSVSFLTNNGDITYTSATQSNNMYISGVVGKEDDGSTPALKVFTDCTNNGSITATKESTTNGYDLVMSGVTGTLRLPEGTIAKNLVNTGDLTAAGAAKNIRISGLTSYTNNTVMESCSNSGDITVEGTASATGTPFLHGLFGASTTSPSITKCNNSGNITLKSGFTSTADSNFYMSGLAYSVTGGMQFTDNHNTGNLKIEGTDTEFKKLVYVSGLVDAVSGAGTTVKNCTNKGKIDIGAYTNATTGNNGRLYVGGLFRTVTAGSIISKCKNLKEATINVAPKSIATEIMVAAFVSYISGSTEIAFTDCSNEADITVAAEYANGLYMGALFGQVYSKDTTFFLTFTRCNNSGNITLGGKSYSYVVKEDGTVGVGQIMGVGGMFGYTLGTNITFDNCDNSGTVTANPTGNCYRLAVGGFGGWQQHRLDNYVTTFKNCDVTGNVVYAPKTITEFSRVGGFHGFAYGHTSYSKGQDIYENCTFGGEVSVSGEGTLSNRSFIGSFIGDMSQSSKFTSCSATDSSKVTVSIKKTNTIYLGWMGQATSLEATPTYDYTRCSNNATVVLSSTGLGALELSGFAGGAYCYEDAPKGFRVNVTDCSVSGSITMSGKCGGVRYGGLNAYPYASGNQHTITNFTNDCDFIFTGETTAALQVGGVAAYLSAAIKSENITVSGDFTFSGKAGTYVSYGGYAQNANITVGENHCATNFVHTGNVTITGTVGTNLLVGAFSAQQKTPYTANGITSTGNITCGTVDKPLTVGGTYMAVGGLYSDLETYAEKPYSLEGKKVCTGNISVENITFTNAAATCNIGGIVGIVKGADIIDNSDYYGTIRVINVPRAKVGLIAGSARTSGVVTNCAAGGNLVLSTENGEDADGNPEIKDVLTPITTENWFKYIYGAETTLEEVTEDGCSHLTAKPTVTL